jgi:hypothetical protein
MPNWNITGTVISELLPVTTPTTLVTKNRTARTISEYRDIRVAQESVTGQTDFAAAATCGHIRGFAGAVCGSDRGFAAVMCGKASPFR